MSNKICSKCGKIYNSFGILDGSSVCNDCFTETNPDVPDYESNDWVKNNNSKSHTSSTLNKRIADTYISLNNIFTVVGVFLLAIIGLLLGNEFGFFLVISGLFILIVFSGIFSIFVEIYRSLGEVEVNLREINSKMKHTDND